MLKGRCSASEFSYVATITRDTQLDLLHYVIETQRLVNAVPATGLKGSERVIGVVLDRVQIVTNADGAAVEVAEGNVLIHRAVSGLTTDAEGARVDVESSLSGLCVRVRTPLLCRDTETDAGSTRRPVAEPAFVPSLSRPSSRPGDPRRLEDHVGRGGAL